MERPLEAEEHIAPPPQGDLSAALEAATVLGELEDIRLDSIDEEVRELISRCMEGTEDPGRPLKLGENKKFNAQNVTVVLLKSAGFRGGQIAEMLGLDQARISVVCNHPYGKKIIQAMLHRQGGRVLDIRTKLETYASELLDQVFDQAQKSNDLKITAALTFGLLDRAGYSTVQKSETKSLSVTATATPQNIQNLTDALAGSMSIDREIMPNFVVKPPPNDGGQQVQSPAAAPALPSRRSEP